MSGWGLLCTSHSAKLPRSIQSQVEKLHAHSPRRVIKSQPADGHSI